MLSRLEIDVRCQELGKVATSFWEQTLGPEQKKSGCFQELNLTAFLAP